MPDQDKKPGRPRDDARADAMRLMYIRGYSLRQVGEDYGITGEAVRQIFIRRGWSIRKTRKEERP
jgi:uncharacterized protein YjcR